MNQFNPNISNSNTNNNTFNSNLNQHTNSNVDINSTSLLVSNMLNKINEAKLP